MSTAPTQTGDSKLRLTRRGWFVVGMLWMGVLWVGIATANWGLEGWAQ